MRRAVISISLAALSLLVSTSSTPSLAGDLPRDFVGQYAPAVEKLREFYSHVTVRGTLKHALPQQAKSLEQKFVFRAASPQVRLDVTTTANKGMNAKLGGSDMYMATSYGSLTTIRNPGSSTFDDARQLNYNDTKSHIESTCLLNYVYTFADHKTILDYLQQPNVQDVKITKIHREGETLVKITYRETSAADVRKSGPPAWFVLSPTEGWAVREYSRTVGEGTNAITYRGTLTYEGTKDTVPLVKGIESVQEQGGARVTRDVVQVSKIVSGNPKDEYFTSFDF